jgi:aerobic C4-dicarboxylate transport protein
LYLYVLAAVVLGVLLGWWQPELAASLKPLGDGFIKLVKMIIGPIIFATVATGIARCGEVREVGRIGIKALLYFELVSTLALAIGLIVVNSVQPGAGLHADPASLDAASVSSYTSGAKALSTVDFLLNIIPSSVVDAFAKGEILQILLFAVLFGLALASLRERSEAVVQWLEQANEALFGVVAMIMRLAPIGAFGAMAFTIGKYGLGAVLSLGKLMAAVYLTCLLFVALVLGGIARLHGFSLWKLLRHIQEEILIVLGTSSSESALPRLMAKLESFGCRREVVGLVVPTGYSFNLDGTSIYLTMAALFIAQATDTPLDFIQQLALLAVLMLTSKGAAAVTGGGFIVLAATLSSTGTVPVAGLALLLGVDRFMSEARAITNLIGNAVATVVVARWEGAFKPQSE